MTTAALLTYLASVSASSAQVVTPPGYYPVTNYGAVCDGVTDDLAAFQAAVSAADVAGGGSVLIPPGDCLLSDTLTVGAGGGSYHHVSLVGSGSDSTHLDFTGTMDRPALFADHLGYTQWTGFSVSSPTPSDFGSHGTAIGILVGADSGSGTQSVRVAFVDVGVTGFKYGLLVGELTPSVSDASEFACTRCHASYNDVGMTSSGYNTLNLHFLDCDWLANTHGYEIGGDAGPSVGPFVEGGSTALNSDADFWLGNGFDASTIVGVRAEPHGYFLQGNGPPNTINLTGDTVAPTSRLDHEAVHVPNETSMTLIGDTFGPSDTVSFGCGSLTMVNNHVAPGVSGLPFTFACGGARASQFVRLEGNVYSDSTETTFADYTGIVSPVIDGGNVEIVAGSYQRPGWKDPGGGVRLNVRALGGGSIVQGNNLAGVVTFPSSGTAAFTFSRGITVDTTRHLQTIAFSSGAITTADLGKPISIVGAPSDSGPACTGANAVTHGIVASVLDSTHAAVAMGDATEEPHGCTAYFGDATAVVATIGVDEPDSNWFVTGLACNRNETIYVDDTTYATSGVTLKSSNVASTATCHFIVTR